MDSPDIIDSAAITFALATRFIGRRVLYYPAVSSTMDVARQEVSQQAPEGTAIIAERQTAGRGRLKRSWVTPEGNIAVSIILYPRKEVVPSLTILAALAVQRGIEIVTGLKCQLKWPNDVLINNRKVCGILLESRASADSVDYAIIGIGINVNMRLADYPELQPIATSLADELGRTAPRVALLRQLFIEAERLYLTVMAGKSVLPQWQANLTTLGKQVQVHYGDEVFAGTAEAVAEDGALLLRRPDGTLHRFLAGDVSLRE